MDGTWEADNSCQYYEFNNSMLLERAARLSDMSLGIHSYDSSVDDQKSSVSSDSRHFSKQRLKSKTRPRRKYSWKR